MNPGDTISPSQSITSACSTFPVLPDALSIFPSTISRSATSSNPRDGSRMRPPRSRIGGLLTLCRFCELWSSAGEQVEDSHSDCDSVRNLVKNHAVRAVGDIRVDLDSAVHRTRVKNENVTRRTFQSFARHAEHSVVF